MEFVNVSRVDVNSSLKLIKQMPDRACLGFTLERMDCWPCKYKIESQLKLIIEGNNVNVMDYFKSYRATMGPDVGQNYGLIFL